jgi:hypothetical protein
MDPKFIVQSIVVPLCHASDKEERNMKFRVFWDVLPCSKIDETHRLDEGGSTHL